MSIQDYRDREQEIDIRKKALKPRPVFLVSAWIFGFAAAGVLFNWQTPENVNGKDFAYFYPFLLIVLVGLAAFMVACYRSPALGARLLGYGSVLDHEIKDRKVKPFRYTSGFSSESPADEKRAASRRLTARQTRRRYARQSRSNISALPSEKNPDVDKNTDKD